MKGHDISLTNTEWNLMECLWELSPRTGREAADYMREHAGWSRSTTLTMLRRMTGKGLIRCEEKNGIKAYSPLLRREDSVVKETDDFIKRVYKGSVSLMMSAITKKQELTKEEIEELYAILRKAGAGEGKSEKEND
jgi:BlaI family penicillinase repressor